MICSGTHCPVVVIQPTLRCVCVCMCVCVCVGVGVGGGVFVWVDGCEKLFMFLLFYL